MLDLAMAALDQESAEFHGDPSRTYLTGLSLGGYGAWELARLHPHRWAAIVIAAGGVFWSYEPDRWQEASVLPAEYAREVGHTPVWLFHGSLDNVVLPRQSELMFDAFKAAGGDIRLWIYQGLLHDCWTRAYDEPELPRWLLAHHTSDRARSHGRTPGDSLRPPTVNLTVAQLDSLAGEYREPNGHGTGTIFRQGDQLFEKSS
jgi:predicted peptidase